MYEKLSKITAAAIAAVLMLSGAAAAARADDAQPEKLRLMCLGDSITDGFWMPGGYRNTLCGLVKENGLEEKIDFVGPNWGGSGYDPQHAGYSGYSIDNIRQEDSISGGRTGISSFSEKLMQDYPADVIFMQIGTNDILSLYDLDHFGERLEKLADSIEDTLPENGMLYLATLPVMDATNTLYISEYFFTVESMDAAVESCNAQIRTLVEKMQSEGRHVQLAEINKVLTKADLFDGVHPSEAGYEKMGKFWYEKLTAYLGGSTVPAETTAAVTTTASSAAETTITTTTVTASAASETTVTETTAPPAVLRGDTDGNGRLEIADAVMLAKHLATEQKLDETQAARADFNADHVLNAVDLTLIKRAL